jgi:hypothetical protein
MYRIRRLESSPPTSTSRPDPDQNQTPIDKVESADEEQKQKMKMSLSAKQQATPHTTYHFRGWCICTYVRRHIDNRHIPNAWVVGKLVLVVLNNTRSHVSCLIPPSIHPKNLYPFFRSFLPRRALVHIPLLLPSSEGIHITCTSQASKQQQQPHASSSHRLSPIASHAQCSCHACPIQSQISILLPSMYILRPCTFLPLVVVCTLHSAMVFVDGERLNLRVSVFCDCDIHKEYQYFAHWKIGKSECIAYRIIFIQQQHGTTLIATPHTTYP